MDINGKQLIENKFDDIEIDDEIKELLDGLE